MEAEQILAEIHKLLARERAEGESDNDQIQNLQDAVESLEDFVRSEEGENDQKDADQTPALPPTAAGIVDTSVLTGPINSLKNFLVKKTIDQQS